MYSQIDICFVAVLFRTLFVVASNKWRTVSVSSVFFSVLLVKDARIESDMKIKWYANECDTMETVILVTKPAEID